MKRLNDKTILITGAASGIGQALALELNKIGACVIGVDIDQLQDTKSQISTPDKFFEYIIDVSIKDNWAQLRKDLIDKNLIPDILINNAGKIMHDITINDVDENDFKKMMDTNFWSAFYGTKALLPELLNKKGERAIVNVSSSFGLVACGWAGAYVTSKFAMRGFSGALSQELFGTGILVSCVYPGAVRTNIAKNFIELTQKRENIPLMPPSRAAKIIIRGILKNKKRIVLGYDSKFLDFISRLLPAKYEDFMVRQLLKDKF